MILKQLLGGVCVCNHPQNCSVHSELVAGQQEFKNTFWCQEANGLRYRDLIRAGQDVLGPRAPRLTSPCFKETIHAAFTQPRTALPPTRTLLGPVGRIEMLIIRC